MLQKMSMRINVFTDLPSFFPNYYVICNILIVQRQSFFDSTVAQRGMIELHSSLKRVE